MTMIQTTRPTIPAVARPATPTVGAGGIPTIDPIRLLKRFKWLLLGAAGAGMMLGIVAHFALMWMYPIWRPETVFQCSALEGDIGKIGAQANFKEELEKFMATQVALLMSDRTIDKAVSDPMLPTEAPKWARQFMYHGTLDARQAAKELKKHLGAGIMGESNLISLSFWWTDPDDATAIVKIVSRTYLADTKYQADLTYSDRKGQITRSITELTTTIGQLQTRRSRLLQDQKVDTLEQQNTSTMQNIQQMQKKLIETRADKDSFVVRRDEMVKEKNDPRGITYPDEIRKKVDEDPTILRIKDDLNSIDSELIAAKQRLGPNHPQIRRLETLKAGREQNLKSEQEKLLGQYFDAQFNTLEMTIAGLQSTESDLLGKLETLGTRAVELSKTLAEVKDLDNEIQRSTESRAKLNDDLKSIDILTTGTRRVNVIQDPQRPKTVSFPKLYFMIPLGIFVVLGLVVGAILLVEVVDQRVKSPSDVALVPRTKVLGMVPHASEDPAAPTRVETVYRDQPGGVLAEHFRQLRAAVLKRMHQAGHKSLLILSGQPGSGSTTVVCNLAQALASAEQRVLVIDANFRRPGVHRTFGLPEGPGLADVLSGAKTLAEAVQKTDEPRLSVLTAGSVEKRKFEGLATEPISELLRTAAGQYDMILLDVSPASISGDAMALANRCDSTMLVVRAFGEKRGLVARLRNELGEVRAEFLGVLVNAVRSSAGGYLKGNILASHQYQTGPSA